MSVMVRHMMKNDLITAVEIERMANTVPFDVPGVGKCEALAPYAWTQADFLNALRQYKSKSRGTWDTRGLVAVSTVSGEVEVEIVAGSMVYESQDDGFEILRLSAVAGDDRTRRAFVDKLIEICHASKKCHRLRCHVSDGDWENLRFFVKLGWHRRLVPNFFKDGRDAWLVEVQVITSPPRRDMAGA